MFEPHHFSSFLLLLLLLLLPWLLLLLNNKIFSFQKLSPSPSKSHDSRLPSSYPLIGSFFAIRKHLNDPLNWISDTLRSSPSSTFILHVPLGDRQIFTANAANVEHILKTHFENYHKGSTLTSILHDLLGHGIFNTNGHEWKFQRQVASHEFNTKSLRKFVETVVDAEFNHRLIPILSDAAKNGTVLDLQDILKRFAFDNICQIAFGHDPDCLSPSFPECQFAAAFDKAIEISTHRLRSLFPFAWKVERLLNIGSEIKLQKAVSEVREFARKLVRQKKNAMDGQKHNSLPDSNLDLLSRFLKSGLVDEQFVTDIVISFILAGRDTTSSALTWFFWLLSGNPGVEDQILKEITEMNSNGCISEERSVYEEIKHMVYTHASLCESMRLYPPVPIDTKEAVSDDVLPDGTKVKRGMRVIYHPYAMGRSDKLWGEEWPEFRPERWLDRENGVAGKWRFVPRDPYSYPVFQAGPRICLGKEMAFLQMKRLVAGVLRRFRVVPVAENGFEPVYVPYLTAMMKGGFPVKIEERIAMM
ncbi:hypothetical protein Nepgr_022715 [Nepenthes gracilis]|uniref:Cytochrome P450 n=1 Tax=Nepenthes gracilis TaxID=150966 RepID=A0AAD3T0T4_NEPGR|nr:hypothetical protein Nepgr_022715 [Nepenthes gracilis]